MKLLNLKEWKDELHEAELTKSVIILQPEELQHFISEIESLRKKAADQLTFEKKRATW